MQRSLQVLMSTVAERAISTVLATAEINWAILLGGIRNRGKSTSLVGSITEGLRCAFAAGAPVVGLASFEGDGNREFLSDDGFRHTMCYWS